MHVGTQQFSTEDEDLEYLARHGVFNKNENNITFHREYGWDVEELSAKKEKCARFGIDMEMVALPIAGLNVNGGQVPNYMLGNYEEGDKEIELVCNMVRQASEAGIPAIKYYLCEMENQRTESDPPGRGGSIYSTWDLEKAKDRPARYDEPVTAEMNWARITYFLERVIPVATECKVPHGLPSLRPVAAARLPLRRPRARRLRWFQAVHRDLPQPLSWRQSLPWLYGGEFAGSPQRGAGHHPLPRLTQQDLPLPLPQHRGRAEQVPGGLARRGRDEHAPQHAGAQGGRLRSHVRARPRAGAQGTGQLPPGLRPTSSATSRP